MAKEIKTAGKFNFPAMYRSETSKEPAAGDCKKETFEEMRASSTRYRARGSGSLAHSATAHLPKKTRYTWSMTVTMMVTTAV